MADNKVKFLRGSSNEYKSTVKDNDTFYYTTDDEKLYIGDKEITGGGITVDDALSDTSEHPVQNKVIKSALDEKLDTSLKGTVNGLAELDSSGKVLTSQLPSYVDDVIEGYLYNNKFYKESAYTTEITGETGKIYVDLSTNKTYRWSGSAFVVISETLALGETSSTAYRGDRGKIAYDHSQSAHAPADAEANVQVDWNETDTTSDAYIKNKPESLPANGGNADTVDGKHSTDFASSEDNYWMYTLDSSGNKHGTNHRLLAKFSVKGDRRFYIQDEDEHQVRVNYADSADHAINASNLESHPASDFALKTDIPTTLPANGGNASTANFATYSDYAGGSVQPTASNACLRNISAGTADLSAGVSELATGAIYLVYE